MYFVNIFNIKCIHIYIFMLITCVYICVHIYDYFSSRKSYEILGKNIYILKGLALLMGNRSLSASLQMHSPMKRVLKIFKYFP